MPRRKPLLPLPVRGGRGGGQPAPRRVPGEYTFTLNAGGKTYVQKASLVSVLAPAEAAGGRGEPNNLNDR